MSIKLLLTGSEDFGKAEIELDDEHASVGYLKSEQFSDLAAEVVAQQTLLAKNLKASHGLTDLLQRPTQIAQESPQPAQPPAWAQQQSNVVPLQQQGGRTCEQCGQPLVAKTTSSNKNVWRCEQWRWNNGNPNGHTSLKPGEGF